MIIAVTGSRTWRDARMIDSAIYELIVHSVTLPHLVLGGQKSVDPETGEEYGADWLAQCAAEKYALPYMVIPADWRKHGKAAGPIRNRLMLDQKPELVLAFWDGRSRGTKDTMFEAARRGIRVQLYEESVR